MKTPEPLQRSETVREILERVLRDGSASSKDLSSAARISEKDVAEHLSHLAKSLKAKGGKPITEPSTCIACGYAFTDRKRFTKPGACPKCRSTRIDPPSFRIEEVTPDNV